MNKLENIKPLLIPISIRDSEFSTLRVIRKKELQKLIPLDYQREKQVDDLKRNLINMI